MSDDSPYVSHPDHSRAVGDSAALPDVAHQQRVEQMRRALTHSAYTSLQKGSPVQKMAQAILEAFPYVRPLDASDGSVGHTRTFAAELYALRTFSPKVSLSNAALGFARHRARKALSEAYRQS